MPLTDDYNYFLPKELIAQKPVHPRDKARLLGVNRKNHELTDRIFSDLIDILGTNDVLVLNDSKVFPARLVGKKTGGGKAEILLIHPLGKGLWLALGKNVKLGQKVVFSDNLRGDIVTKSDTDGQVTVKLWANKLDKEIDLIGLTPIPPYIKTVLPENILRKEYQTVYANKKGSSAAPTAGMHFTKSLLVKLINKGVQIEKVTLHVGLGTFATLKPKNILLKKLHREWYEINMDTAMRLNRAKNQGKRIIAVGTTSLRTLESAIINNNKLTAETKSTDLFIMPPYKFIFVDALITNFHLPKSSLLMLVTAFGGKLIAEAYDYAVKNKYRFFSFGDAMMIE